MLDLNDAYAIAKYIKDAEKQTPVKIYVSTTAEIEKNENFKVFGNNGEYTLIGDYKTITEAIAPIKDKITDMYVENTARNSAIPMVDMLNIDARIEPGAIIRDMVTIEKKCCCNDGCCYKYRLYYRRRNYGRYECCCRR